MWNLVLPNDKKNITPRTSFLHSQSNKVCERQLPVCLYENTSQQACAQYFGMADFTSELVAVVSCTIYLYTAPCIHTIVLKCACFTQELVEYYKQYSLKEGFSSLDTTLQVPYREPSSENMPRAITKAGSGESTSWTAGFFVWQVMVQFRSDL